MTGKAEEAIVEQGKRINASCTPNGSIRLNQIRSVPDEYLYERITAENIHIVKVVM